MSSALTKIRAEVKRLQKKHPNAKFRTLQKQAGSAYRNGKLGATRSKPRKKKKAAPRKRAKRRSTRKKRTVTVVRAVRVVGQHKRPRSRRKRSARKIGKGRTTGKVKTVRYRQVGGKGNSKLMTLLMIAALGVGAYLIFRKPKSPVAQLPPGTPPLVLTTNPTRNSAANNILAYAMAGGLAIDAISRLIQSLNGSSDSEVQAINSGIQTGSGLPNNLFV